MSYSKLIALGFMAFALFLGAGNIIFPPMLGQGSGEFFGQAITGFLITAVGLPALTLLIIAYLGGSDNVTGKLPRWGHLMFWSTLFLIIGPLFNMPRTYTVAYEFALKPFFGDDFLLPATIFFGGVTLFFALSPGKLMDRVGKLLTPIILIMIALMTYSAINTPHGSPAEVAEQYQHFAFAASLSEGYMTMDVLGAIGFGWLIVNAIKSTNTTQPLMQEMVRVVIVYATAMSLVYIALAHIGSSFGDEQSNGGALLSAYMGWIYGQPGKILLGGVMAIACLTTAIGLTCACSDYAEKNFAGFNYTYTAIGIVVATIAVANLGLETIISITLPLVVVLHPVTITVLALALVYHKRAINLPVYGATITASIIGGGIDAAKILGVLSEQLTETFTTYLPLFAYNISWLVPTILVFAISHILAKCLAGNKLATA